jgi:quercetin dioxygenase-like cupin family protein
LAVKHAKPGDIVEVSPLGDRFAGATTTTLIKSESLEVIRLVLPAGKELPSHAVPGEITVQCLEGRVELTADDRRLELRAEQLVYLAGGVRHALKAIENATLLVTILLRHKTP